MTYIYDNLGRRIKTRLIASVEKLVNLKQKSGSNPWPVIEECFNIWASEKPRKWQSYLLYLQDIKETRKDPKFASTTDKVTGGILRYTLDIPQEVMMMIRCVYKANELPMNRLFFQEFARRFPKCKIAEKL